MKIILIKALLVFSILLMPSQGMAVLFEWVCDTPGCNGDPGFSSYLDLSDAAVAAGSFTGVAGNILSAGVTSGVGDGFSLSLSHMLSGPPGTSIDDVNHIYIALNAAKTEITELLDISYGTNITFDALGIGRVDFLENTAGNPYYIQFVQDQFPAMVELGNGISGRFVRSAVIPEPSTFILLGGGLAVFAAAGIRKIGRRRD